MFFFAELLYLERANATHYHEFFPAALVIYRDDETKGISMNVLFSGNSLHSLAATVNLISNFELQLLTNGNNRIKTTNAPMHRYGTKSDESPLSIANIFPLLYPSQESNQDKQSRFGRVCYVYADGNVLLHFVLRFNAIQ